MPFTFVPVVHAGRSVRLKSIAHPCQRLFVGVALGAMAVIGCSSGLEAANGRTVRMEGGNSVEIAARLADASSVAAAYPAVEMTVTQTVGDTQMSRTVGRFNNSPDPADVTGEMTVTYGFPAGMEIDMRLVDGVAYSTYEGLSGGWIRLDSENSPAGSFAPPMPAATLDQLREAGDVVMTGSSDIDGVMVDNYDFTIDMTNVTAELVEGLDPSVRGVEFSGSVSLDADGFARSMRIEMDMSRLVEGQGGSDAEIEQFIAMLGGSVVIVEVTMKPLDAPVVVVAPDPSELSDIQVGG